MGIGIGIGIGIVGARPTNPERCKCGAGLKYWHLKWEGVEAYIDGTGEYIDSDMEICIVEGRLGHILTGHNASGVCLIVNDEEDEDNRPDHDVYYESIVDGSLKKVVGRCKRVKAEGQAD